MKLPFIPPPPLNVRGGDEGGGVNKGIEGLTFKSGKTPTQKPEEHKSKILESQFLCLENFRVFG
jgi:hypothetical protein